MPPGETGAGDSSVLHTRDGGKSWHEIPEPWQHNEEPSVAFASRTDGWLRDTDIVAAESRLLETHDAGTHWRRLPMRDLFMHQIQYFGEGVGYGLGYDIDQKQGYLIATRDHGQHWDKSRLPHGFTFGRMHFVDDQRGIIAGCFDRQPSTIRTEDGGKKWMVTLLNLPHPATTGLKYCDYEPDSMDFVDTRRGWLVTSKHFFGLNDDHGDAVVWSTSDGGVTWQSIYHATYSPSNDWFGGVRFLDSEFGFVWKGNSANDKVGGVLLYTTDGGQHWNEAQLAHAVADCQRYNGSLQCAAAGNGFWTLRVSRADQQPPKK